MKKPDNSENMDTSFYNLNNNNNFNENESDNEIYENLCINKDLITIINNLYEENTEINFNSKIS